MPSTIKTWYLTTTVTGTSGIKPFRWHHLRIPQCCCGLHVLVLLFYPHVQWVHNRYASARKCTHLNFLKPSPQFSTSNAQSGLFPFLSSPGKNPQFFHWREGMTTSSYYNSTCSTLPWFLFFFFACLPSQSISSSLFLIKRSSAAFCFASPPCLCCPTRVTVSHHFEGNLFINVISGYPQASISMLTQNMPV